DLAYPKDKTIVKLFEEQVEKTPAETALVFEERALTYQQLDALADQLAYYLIAHHDIQSGELVGIKQPRSEWMVISMLGILKAGAAYVPIDPDNPAERVGAILEDSRCKVLLDTDELRKFKNINDELPAKRLNKPIGSEQLAYVIYTSGSTGVPKGVMIEHRNVVNFFNGMTSLFGEENGTLLATTNFTFDISVLELLWTLTNGFKVVIQGDTKLISESDVNNRPLDFSLFYFGNSNAGQGDYKLLMEGAKYADKNGFKAIWTPERHFNEFGGLYPNPSLMAASLSAITEKVDIRSGSVVVPLHHPAKIAEDWSVIDNLSNGRAGIACASGWHANDFVISPGSYKKRHEKMYESIDALRKLWKGESVAFENGNGELADTKIFPHPVQDEIPIWITSAGNIDTFISAGKVGANILTHLLGNSIDDLADKVAAYRKSYKESGFDVSKSIVTLMVHTYIDEEENIEKKARQPFIEYIKSSAGLIKQLIPDYDNQTNQDRFSEDDMEAIYERAYNRFVSTSSLVGTAEDCYKRLQKLSAIGIDEIASLIDFGVDFDSTMQSLERIKELKTSYNTFKEDYSIQTQIKNHDVSHLQITPSMGVILNQHLSDNKSWQSLRTILIGGEPATVSLIDDLNRKLPDARLYNMYGPTETTIWSTVKEFNKEVDKIEIGKPIANTKIYILDRNLQLVPQGVPGEIYIGGDGVARGYTDEQLSDRSFVTNPYSTAEKFYRTGDFGQWLEDGSIYCFGRKDQQVKIRGHRIELGEIEKALLAIRQIKEVVVLVRGSDEKQLVAYFTSLETHNTAELRTFLKQKLPPYMIPNFFVQMAALPLNSSGKIAKNLLPDPDGSGLASGVEYIAPRNEIEEKLVGIWKELLQVEKIGVYDDFFALGGHSLNATQLIIRIEHIFSVKINLRNLIDTPTIDNLAEEISTLTWLQEKNEETNIGEDELIL
ncbi:MAG: MupA/Atu3671 family FMN-dependent luciferase-like monooxygenase, partial [Cyclobacteriaceae bacterium]